MESMSDLLDALARAIHEDYVRRTGGAEGGPGEDLSLLPWDQLPDTLRNSNRNQALDIERKLEAIGCDIAPESEARRSIDHFSDDEVEQLAQLEHLRWEAERRADGWTYGPTKDVATKRTPYLVPWDELSEEVRDLDRDTVRQIPDFLRTAHLAVVRADPAPLPR
jgi:RyR domain